jgi:TRAP-type C4-dicarboxylate transport system permease large subunit
MSAVIGLAMKRLTWAGMIEALRLTIRVTAMIFLIISGAKIFGYYMTLSQVPQNLLTLVMEMQLNRWVVIAGIVVGYFVISMFMDEIPLLLITLSLTFPLVMSLGFDPVWFGVLSILMVAMGLVFPPVGMVAFVVSATANVKLTKVYKGTSILVVALVATTILVMIFPQLALWLPSRMK